MPVISFSYLNAMARTSNIILNSSGESGLLFLDLSGGNVFSFSPLSMTLAVGFS